MTIDIEDIIAEIDFKLENLSGTRDIVVSENGKARVWGACKALEALKDWLCKDLFEDDDMPDLEDMPITRH